MDMRGPPAGFVRLDHYDHFYPYWATPIDYFTPAARATLAAKTGHVFGLRVRTAEPVGGTHMQDVPRTAAGNWFLPGRYHANSTDLSPFLGLASDYVEPAQPLIAAGTSIAGLPMGLYSFPLEGTGLVNRAFADVIADGRTYCYDRFLLGQSIGGLPLSRPSGVLLMTMPSASSLRVQFVPGGACGSSPMAATAGTVFER
jgi:hypothetical protein